MSRDKLNKIWQPCNIYKSVMMGADNSIGAFTEIGHEVMIGNNNRIGAQCFIPEGVIISDDVFIGPKVCFTNDKYPPSSKENWAFTVVRDKAAIGAGSIILAGICIGEKALIGAGSVVTKSVPDGEVWCGNPAKKIKDITEVEALREEQRKRHTEVMGE